MGMDNKVFLEVIEWFDKTGQEIVHRIPQKGSAEIKWGARLIVRESQAAVFFYHGKAFDAFGAGNHHLSTANIPLLNKVMAIPWGLTSPLRAEVCFVNMKTFTNLKWGTRDPVAFKDNELGLVRLRAHGIYNMQVIQPVLFINSLVGTLHAFDTTHIEEYLSRVIVSRFNDYIGETLDSILNIPSRYDELAAGLLKRIQSDFSRFGMRLSDLFINAITPPPEVQKAIDDRGRMNVIDDMNKLFQMKSAMAMEKIAENPGDAGSMAGMGMGFMMPAMFSQQMAQQSQAAPAVKCPDCTNPIPADAKFCPYCGHQAVIFQTCLACGKNLPPHARFCMRCGAKAESEEIVKICKKCNTQNLRQATFCNQCGEKL